MKIPFILISVMLLCCLRESTAQQMHYASVTINQPSQLIANAGSDVVGATELDVQLGGSPTATGGTPPYSYTWSPANNLSDSDVANPELDIIEADEVYSVTVVDAAGCTS